MLGKIQNLCIFDALSRLEAKLFFAQVARSKMVWNGWDPSSEQVTPQHPTRLVQQIVRLRIHLVKRTSMREKFLWPWTQHNGLHHLILDRDCTNGLNTSVSSTGWNVTSKTTHSYRFKRGICNTGSYPFDTAPGYVLCTCILLPQCTFCSEVGYAINIVLRWTILQFSQCILCEEIINRWNFKRLFPCYQCLYRSNHLHWIVHCYPVLSKQAQKLPIRGCLPQDKHQISFLVLLLVANQWEFLYKALTYKKWEINDEMIKDILFVKWS